MGILDRFASIIKANINDLLEKAEDPAKMIDQYLIDMTEDLAEVKKETAGVMAEEARTKRLVDENVAEVQKYDGLARKALQAGNEDDARAFLAKKQQIEAKGQSLQESYAAAKTNAERMRQMHDKLVKDINELKGRREAIKAKVAVAKTQERVNAIASTTGKAEGAIGAFDRMEAKADAMLDRANAHAELNETPSDPIAELEEKYATAGSDVSVDAELAKLKSEMGL